MRPKLPCYGCGQPTAPLDLCDNCSLDYLTYRVKQAKLSLSRAALDTNPPEVYINALLELAEVEKDLARAKGRLEGRLEGGAA